MYNNLMPTITEAYNAVTGNAGKPCYRLTEDEASQLLDVCERAKVAGPLLVKVQTMANYAAAKNRYTGREARVTME